MTTLDPRTALVVIDRQESVASLPAQPPVQDVLHHARALLIDLFGHRRA